MKAAEAATLLDFSVHILNKYGGVQAFGEAFMGAGWGLTSLVVGLKRFPVMPDDRGMAAITNALRVLTDCWEAAGLHFTPKHHLLTHMVFRTQGPKLGFQDLSGKGASRNEWIRLERIQHTSPDPRCTTAAGERPRAPEWEKGECGGGGAGGNGLGGKAGPKW